MVVVKYIEQGDLSTIRKIYSMKNLLMVLSVVALSLFTSAAFAVDAASVKVPYEQCAELVKECFAESEMEQSNCFFSSAKHPFCEGTALGDVVLKRWSLSPEKSNVLEAPPALLGPQIIDGQCLKNFDAKFSDILIRDDLTEATIKQTDKNLENCKKDVSNQLTRP